MYMWIISGLFVLSLGLLLIGPLPNTALHDLSIGIQNLLNAAMFLGSSICLYGIMRGEHGIIQKDGDIRISYNLAISGAPAIIASLGTYCLALIDYGNFVPSTLGAVISMAIIGGTIQNVWDFWQERKRITRNIELLRTNKIFGDGEHEPTT